MKTLSYIILGFFGFEICAVGCLMVAYRAWFLAPTLPVFILMLCVLIKTNPFVGEEK